ncbi:MAG: hypothetical protein J0H92_15710 [Sphingobacteriales bacterium]|nr:hypothetical protein [Sphingobacteriales bacterium]OJW32542.1 MAG: hypothetical protein BGO54_19350 [Sphingobacteriales bacterium 46-32]
MKKQLISFVLYSLILASCGKLNRLSEEDYSWMPYNGDETLVFKSSTGEIDSIFLIKKDTLLAYPEAQSINGVKYEEVAVFCNHYRQDNQNVGRSYYLFKVQKAKDNRAELVFDLSTKGNKFYRLLPVKIYSLRKESPVSLETSFGKYNDIYIIYPDDNAKDFYQLSNFVTKLYWSKSQGLIRFDKKDGVFWELSR